MAELAAAEPLRKLPTQSFPAVIEAQRVVSAQALVAWNGNFYSVPPGHADRQVIVRHKLGTATLDVMTAAGTVLARHRGTACLGIGEASQGSPRSQQVMAAGRQGKPGRLGREAAICYVGPTR